MKRIHRFWMAGLGGSLLPVMVLATLETTVPTAVSAGSVWTYLGPDGGSINLISIDPGDTSTLYVGTGAGSFKSRDGGRSWVNSNVPNGILVFDPQDRLILYVQSAFKLFKSRDGGANWKDSRPELSQTPASCDNWPFINGFVMDQQNPNTMFVATACGVFKSTDGAESWRAVNFGLASLSVRTLVMDPQNSNTLYAGTRMGLCKSTDGGETWRVIRRGATGDALAVDPLNPATLYMALPDEGLFKSTDGGDTWSAASSGPAPQFNLVVDPQNPRTIYALGIAGPGLFKSTDGGESWEDTGVKGFLSFAMDPLHSEILYVGTVFGAFKSIDGARSWSPLFNTGLRATYVRILAVDPQNASTVYAQIGSTDQFMKSVDGGASWIPTISGLRGGVLAIDPQNPRTIYAGGHGGVFKSTDGGESWLSTRLPASAGALAIDPQNTGVVYAGDRNSARVFKSTDGGNTWITPGVSLFEPSGCCPISFLAVDPQNPTTVYAVIYDFDVGGLLWKSTDGGTTWGSIGHGHGPIAFDSQNPNTLYVWTYYGLAKTANGGESWIDSGLRRPSFVGSLAIDPHKPSTVYAGSWGQGIFKSTDGGANWIPVNDGLSNLNILDLVINSSGPTTLYAGTTGGAFRISATSP